MEDHRGGIVPDLYIKRWQHATASGRPGTTEQMWDVKAIGCLASYLNLTNDFRRFPVSTLKSALKVDHDLHDAPLCNALLVRLVYVEGLVESLAIVNLEVRQELPWASFTIVSFACGIALRSVLRPVFRSTFSCQSTISLVYRPCSIARQFLRRLKSPFLAKS